MKVGDLVSCFDPAAHALQCGDELGVIVGFGKKGEGGMDYVHVLLNGQVLTYLRFNVEVVDEAR